jgi:hypothetical protein
VSRYLLLAFGGGAVSVLIYSLSATGSFGGLIFAYFAAVPLFLVGFSLGLAAGATAGATATIGMLYPSGLAGAAVFFCVTALPTIILIRQSLLSRNDSQGSVAWYPAGLMVVTVSVLGAGIYTLAALFFTMQPEGFEGTARAFVENLASSMTAPDAADTREYLVNTLTPILPGFIAASWFVMTVINAALAQALLVRFERNIRPSPDIVLMEFPNWFPITAAAAALVGLLLPGAFGFYGVNLAIILIVPFFFMGLAVIHALCRRKSAGLFFLVTFYGMLIIFGWLVVIVATLGLIEQWVGLRRRFT